MFTYQALSILTFLLPGFLCMAILDMLTPAVKRDNLHRFVTALIFSLIIYGIHTVILQKFPAMLVEKTVDAQKQYSINFEKGSIVFIVGISIFVAVMISVSVKYDLHMKLFRKFKITDRTSRTSLWFDVFTDIKTYVIVNFKDGRRLYGWPEYFSDDPEDKSIFLCQTAWVDDSDNLIDLGIRGVLITSDEEIDTIQFAG